MSAHAGVYIRRCRGYACSRYNALVWVGSHRQRGGKPARVPSGRALYRLPAGLSQSFLPAVTAAFSGALSGCQPEYCAAGVAVAGSGSAQRHDLGLTETLSCPAGTARTELLTLNEVCVLPYDHPLAAKTVLTPDDFQENFINLSRTDGYRQLLDTLFAEHQVKRRMVVETHSAASVCARWCAPGRAFRSLTANRWTAASGVTVAASALTCPLPIGLIRPLRRRLRASVDAFSKHLQTHLSRTVEPLEGYSGADDESIKLTASAAWCRGIENR